MKFHAFITKASYNKDVHIRGGGGSRKRSNSCCRYEICGRGGGKAKNLENYVDVISARALSVSPPTPP